MNTLLFVHGWGFGPEIWDGVRAHLGEFDHASVDLGFRGAPSLPLTTRPLVIGHSMGFAWALANIPFPWSGAMAVNGFARFTRSDDFPAGTAPRPLERMIAKFASEPETVSVDFLGRCGVSAPDVARFNYERLGRGLAWLGSCDERPALQGLDCPLAALAGARDPIVPEAMSRASFAPTVLEIQPEAGHLLPLTHPEWVTQRIAALAATLS